ncbi:hypothetical protein QE374_001741 [Microbacterium sp. SORGH_AS428]|uniref:hypothetical protein n=1 Tax=Microbacterium sp. SORGH_AS_0428 TaxID=3041788 RepID=UPI002857D4B1|nr:hypothetical protein [Microbacterium sp. SORGH_AS_0428]MDR6199832.1 hypothetical protein [Microbacterium sp. SORGH_AS_0428]
MTASDQPMRRRKPKLDAWGTTGVAMAAIAILPTLGIFLIGFIPDMNPIWWLGILLIPMLAVIGAAVLLLGVVGAAVGARRDTSYGLSVASIVLGIVMIAPIAWLWFSGA